MTHNSLLKLVLAAVAAMIFQGSAAFAGTAPLTSSVNPSPANTAVASSANFALERWHHGWCFWHPRAPRCR